MSVDVILLVILAVIVVIVGLGLATLWAIAYLTDGMDDGSDEFGA